MKDNYADRMWTTVQHISSPVTTNDCRDMVHDIKTSGKTSIQKNETCKFYLNEVVNVSRDMSIHSNHGLRSGTCWSNQGWIPRRVVSAYDVVNASYCCDADILCVVELLTSCCLGL